MDRPAVVAQHRGESRLDPEGERRLVEGDEACWIEGIVEEEPEALQHAAHAGGVVGGAEAVVLQPPQPQGGCDQQHGGQRRALTPSTGVRLRQSSFPGRAYAGYDGLIPRREVFLRWGRATPVARSSSRAIEDAPLEWRAPSNQ